MRNPNPAKESLAMKYAASQAMGETPKLEWPGFSIPVHTSYGAECIAKELNRLDTERQKAEDSLGVQIEAKCKAINTNQSNLKKLTELINIQKSQGRDRYMTGMLNGLVLARSVLDGENPIYEDHQGGVELNEKQAAHIISTLDSLAITKFVWSPSLREAYEACVVLLGASEAVAAQGTGKSQAFEVVMLMSSPAQYRVVGPDTNLDFGTWKNTAQEVCARLNAQLAEREAREFKLFESNCEKKALEQRLAVRDQQARQLLDSLEAAQMALALYIEPGSRLKPKVVLTDLLSILDGAVLVTMMRNLRAWLGKNPDIYACDDMAGEASVEFLKTDFPTQRYTSGIGLGINGEVEISTATIGEGKIRSGSEGRPHFDIDSPFKELRGLTISVETNGTKLELVGCVDSKEGRRLTVLVSK